MLALQTSRESFRRAFVDPAVLGGSPAEFSPERFSESFRPGRMVRVESNGKSLLRTISAIAPDAVNPQITLSTPLPFCFNPSFAIVTPVARIRYGVEALDQAADLKNLRLSGPGATRTVLVRRELNAETAVAVDGLARVVLDYAVEFQVDAVATTAPPPAAPVYRIVTANVAPTLGTVPVTDFRALRLTLTARTPEPIECFQGISNGRL